MKILIITLAVYILVLLSVAYFTTWNPIITGFFVALVVMIAMMVYDNFK